MTQNTKSNHPIPEGYGTVTPWIIARDAAKLIDYLKAAFDAQELGRVENPDGKIGHAEVKIGDSIVMLFDAQPDWPDTPAFLRLYVEDGDAVFGQAIKAGGTEVTPMTTLAFGDRVGRVRDPMGNLWWIQTRLEQLDFEEMTKRAGEKQYADAMQKVEDALKREMSNRILKQ